MTLRTPLLATAAGFVFIILADETMAQSATMNVQATVAQQCTLSAGTLDFGTYVTAQSTPKNGSAEIDYSCAAGLDIDISLAGTSDGNGGYVMSGSGGASHLIYKLFQDSTRNTPWGANGSALNISNTPGSPETLTVYGAITANQTPAGSGLHADTVNVTLTVN